MKRMADGKRVRLAFEGARTDNYNRTLAYVYLLDDTFLNAELIRQDYAHAYTEFPVLQDGGVQGPAARLGKLGASLTLPPDRANVPIRVQRPHVVRLSPLRPSIACGY